MKKKIIFWVLFIFYISCIYSQSYYRKFEWENFDRSGYWISCNISKKDLINSYNELGLTKDQKKFEIEFEPVEYTYSSQAEKKRKQREIQKMFDRKERKARKKWLKMLKKNGFIIRNNKLMLDHKGIFQNNLHRVNKYCGGFVKIAKEQGLNFYEFEKLLLSFVQEIKYVKVPLYRGKYYTQGLYTPIEILVKKRGDCDSKSILLATLLCSITETKMILIDLKRHMIVGIEGNPRSGQTYLQLGNKNFILCETSTGVWLPGNIDNSIKRQLKRGQYKVIKLY